MTTITFTRHFLPQLIKRHFLKHLPDSYEPITFSSKKEVNICVIRMDTELGLGEVSKVGNEYSKHRRPKDISLGDTRIMVK